jgi:hypothetical protein
MSETTSRYATIQYDGENNWVHFAWEQVAPSLEYREVIQEVIALAANERSEKMLMDASHMGDLAPEDQDWLAGYWCEQGIKAGLRKIAVVMPKEGLGVMTINAMNRVIDPTAEETMEHRFFVNAEDAVGWLKIAN